MQKEIKIKIKSKKIQPSRFIFKTRGQFKFLKLFQIHKKINCLVTRKILKNKSIINGFVWPLATGLYNKINKKSNFYYF